MTDPVSPAGYARAVEDHWSRLSGRPVVLSPRDWAHLTRWHEQGIPLEILREAMDDVAERKRGTDPIRSISTIARLVEEAFRTILDGRLAFRESPNPSPERSACEAWRDKLSGLPEGSPLAALLRALLIRHDEGQPATELDSELDRRLPELVTAEIRDRSQRQLEEQVRPFRERISGEKMAEVLSRGLVERLRSAMGLPRLAGGDTAE